MYTLNDICSLITDGSHFSPEDEGIGYPMLSVKDMDDDDFDFTSCKHVGEEAYQKLLANGCKPLVNDVVLAKDGSYLKTAFPIYQDREIALLSSIAILRPKEGMVDPEYLSYFLKSPKVYRTVSLNYISGTALKRIILKGIKKIPIELPELKEQRYRSQILNAIRQIIRLRKKQLDKLDDLIKARFVEMFDNGSYSKVRLGDVCKKITDGTHRTPNYLDEGITFISAKNIVNGELNFSDVKYISEEEYQEIQKRCQTELNDILLSKSGSLGIPAIVKTDEKLGLFESLAVLKYDRDRFLPEFLCEQLKTDMVQRQFSIGTKGVAVKHLHLGVIADTEIIEPQMGEQKAFAEFVKQIDKSKVAVQRALEHTQILFDSLMQEYFGK